MTTILMANTQWVEHTEIQLWWVFAAIMILVGGIRAHRARRYL